MVSISPVSFVGIGMANIKGLENATLTDLCLQWRDRKISDDPNATGNEDSRIPDHKAVDQMKDKITRVFHSTIDDRYYLAEIWAHILEDNETTMIHSHRNVKDHYNLFLSWVYYPHQHPTDAGGRLRFQIVSHMMMNNHEVTPKEGDIIFFPSFLNHYTTPNVGTEDRISISGNFRLKDEDYEDVYRDQHSGIHAFYS